MKPSRSLPGKKLLKASAGVGVLTFVFCGLFPGCNLMAVSCEDEAHNCERVDQAVPDLTKPADLSEHD